MYKEIRLPARPRLSFRWIVGLVLLFVVLITLGSAIKRVEPGFAGVKIDYARGQTAGETGYAVEQVPAGRFVFINPITQRLAQYPISNQNLTMARRVAEGKVQGDDSVKVVDTNGVTLNIDVSVIYRVMPDKVGDLYTPNGPARQLIDAERAGRRRGRPPGAARRTLDLAELGGQPQLPADLRHGEGQDPAGGRRRPARVSGAQAHRRSGAADP